MNKKYLVFLQLLVSAVLLAWIFWKPDFRNSLWEVLTEGDSGWLLAGFAMAGAASLLGVLRWNVFLRMQGIHLPAMEVLRISFVGLFFNNVLVGAVGGDAVKVLWLGMRGHSKSAGLLSVLMDRMSGFPALLFLTLVFLPRWSEWAEIEGATEAIPLLAWVPVIMFVYLAVITLLLSLTFVVAASGLIERLPSGPPDSPRWRDRIRREMVERLGKTNAAYLLFVRSWRQTLWGSFLSLLILLGYFLTFYCSARAFGLGIPTLDFLAMMPVVDILAALPVSLGGFGVREMVFKTLLPVLTEGTTAQAVATSLSGAILNIVWGLFGLALLPSYRELLRRGNS